jgi:hypothetical protein
VNQRRFDQNVRSFRYVSAAIAAFRASVNALYDVPVKLEVERGRMARRARGVSHDDEEDADAYPLPADSVPEPPDPAEIAGYIADMTDELSKMAAQCELETICYLLTLVRLEAETIARRNQGDD